MTAVCIDAADLLALGALIACLSLLAGYCCALRVAMRLERERDEANARAAFWETEAGKWVAVARLRSGARREVARA